MSSNGIEIMVPSSDKIVAHFGSKLSSGSSHISTKHGRGNSSAASKVSASSRSDQLTGKGGYSEGYAFKIDIQPDSGPLPKYLDAK